MDSFQSVNIILPNNNQFFRFILHNINNNNNNNTINNILEESFNEEINQEKPTCKEFIKNLEEYEIIQEDIDNNLSCAICQESFKLGESIIGIPCKPSMHYFHNGDGDCPGILPWLENNNTCPICRTKFPENNSENDDSDSVLDNESEQEESNIQYEIIRDIDNESDILSEEIFNLINSETFINNQNINNMNNIFNQPNINTSILPEQIINNQLEIINNMSFPMLIEETIFNNNHDSDNIGFSINEIDEAIRRSLNN